MSGPMHEMKIFFRGEHPKYLNALLRVSTGTRSLGIARNRSLCGALGLKLAPRVARSTSRTPSRNIATPEICSVGSRQPLR